MNNYRICIARSGSYYVQRFGLSGWKMIGNFFRTRRGALNLIDDLKRTERPSLPRVVAYY